MAERAKSAPLEDPRERALQERIKAGYVLENEEEMTPRYRDVLVNTVHIAADLEVMALPTYTGFKTGPTLEDKIAGASAVQDELGHAQVMYRMLEDFGYNTHAFLFERDPKEWRSFQMVEYPHADYVETVVAMCLCDRAGYTTTMDLEQNCSFGPFARSLRKVNFEEVWHTAHGERWTRFFWNHTPYSRARVQEVVDFYFPLCVAWFGLPDNLKTRPDQMAYKIRGSSNDEMRQKWLQHIVPFCEDLGIKVPAHYDEEVGHFVLDYEPPIFLDEETRTWDYDRRITWEEQIAIWKRGTPYKVPGLGRLQQEVWGADLW